MRTMNHPNGATPSDFVCGFIAWVTSTLVIKILSINIAEWIPPIISIMSAFASGFVYSAGKDAGKDIYRKWLHKKSSKKEKQ